MVPQAHANTSDSNRFQNAVLPESVATLHGNELLASLLGFIKPIIQVHASASTTSTPPENVASEAGRQLLHALEGFIIASIGPKSFKPERDENAPNDIKDQPTSTGKAASPEVNASFPILAKEIVQEIDKELRPHITNKLPIRLLAFDAEGSHMQLIDRDEMHRRILRNACTAAVQPEFRSEWSLTKGSVIKAGSTVTSEVSERRRKAAIITQLVEHHARYAILSHTWMRGDARDVVYKDWAARADNAVGFAKLERFCAVAATQHGVLFGWADTVCIDKSSSSELDESIRSMHRWYRGAHVCIAYLAGTRALGDMHRDPWFTRGWTLQELLAPRAIRFYGEDWKDLAGSRGDADMVVAQRVGWATSITPDEMELCRAGEEERIPVSRRLQLAAEREVTRAEDAAYSLMGLLGVDISVAYGEGASRACARLLREVLASTAHVLDLFNHKYLDGARNALIPSVIRDYVYRTDAFDDPSGRNRGSLLDLWPPAEPIMLTHLGVRVPVLLVPGLSTGGASDEAQGYIAKGDFSGHAVLSQHQRRQQNFNLLDASIYTGERSFFRPQTPQSSQSSQSGRAGGVVTFAVMNFGVEREDILLPPQCFSVPLDCGDVIPGNVSPSSSGIRILRTYTPPLFKLKSPGERSTITKSELEKHGIQYVTLYL